MIEFNLLLIFLYVISSVALTFFFSKEKRWKGLLITSLLFYFVLTGYKIFILIFIALLVYLMGFAIHRKRSNIKFSVFLILIPLILSKTFGSGFHFEDYSSKGMELLNWFKWSSVLEIIGLSYFTFNALSYLIDIKRKYIEPEKNFFIILLYLIYFPIIFSGPLQRAKNLIPQFKNIDITNESISRGTRLILWGLFKNIIIAQRLFILLEQFLNTEISGAYYFILGLLFFLYLYCNFSSFINIFQGISQIFNIELKDNFKNRVYFSSSRQEFWKGWHITLNEWFRDYFFFVIARYDRKRKYLDVILLSTFILIALWHEFSTTLLLWGLMNGLWIILEKKVNLKKLPFPKLRKATGFMYHLAFSCILALIFISPDISFLLEKIFLTPSYFPLEKIKVNWASIVIVLFSLFVMDYHYYKAKSMRFDLYLENKPIINRWFIYLKLTLIILLFGLVAGVDNYYTLF